jgi:hypothetical protein
MSSGIDAPTFDGSVDLLRERIGLADDLDDATIHSFKELMADQADVLPDHFYGRAFEELQVWGHLANASHVANGRDARGRLSADGRAYLRSGAAGE